MNRIRTPAASSIVMKEKEKRGNHEDKEKSGKYTANAV